MSLGSLWGNKGKRKKEGVPTVITHSEYRSLLRQSEMTTTTYTYNKICSDFTLFVRTPM